MGKDIIKGSQGGAKPLFLFIPPPLYAILLNVNQTFDRFLMHDLERINDIRERVRVARASGPSDVVTKFARILVKCTTLFKILLTPVSMITTAVGGCLVVLTIGFLALPISFVWLPFYYILLGISWLWLKAWYLRPVLLLPGVIIALFGDIYVALLPDFERGSKRKKLAVCEEWPLSWYITHPPKQSVIQG